MARLLNLIRSYLPFNHPSQLATHPEGSSAQLAEAQRPPSLHLLKLRDETSDSTSKSSQSNDSRLLALPLELRNVIWTMLFEPEMSNDDDDEVELTFGTRPNNAVLRVCRQVRRETAELYQDACSKYWNSKFNLTLVAPAWTNTELAEVRSQLSKFKEEDIKKVTRFCIQRSCNKSDLPILKFESGVWSVQSSQYHYARRIFIPDTDPCFRLPSDGGVSLQVLDDDPPRPVFAFLKLRWQIDANEVLDSVGWNGLTKREIIAAVRWFQTLK